MTFISSQKSRTPGSIDQWKSVIHMNIGEHITSSSKKKKTDSRMVRD